MIGINRADFRKGNFSFYLRRTATAVKNSNTALFEAVINVHAARQFGIQYDNTIRLVDLTAGGDGFIIDAEESFDRSSPPFTAEKRKCLGIFAFLRQCPNKHGGRSHSPLPTPGIKDYFFHIVFPCVSKVY